MPRPASWFSLIGGPVDKKLIDIPMDPLPHTLRILDDVGEEDHLYQLHYLAGASRTFPCYAHSSLDGDGILERLLQR